jgi:ribonuclease P protein subunit POP4
MFVLQIVIPKEHTVYRFEILLPAPTKDDDDESNEIPAGSDKEVTRPLVFELHGSQFENRAPDRANKKFKWKGMDYL